MVRSDARVFRYLLGLPLAAMLLTPAKAHAVNYVRSVEYVEINLANGDTTASTNLTKGQALANCVPFASGVYTGFPAGYDFDMIFTDVYLQPAPARVTAQRQTAGGTISVGVYVVEFDPAYVNVQQNTLNFTGTSTTAAITSVDLTKAALVFYYRKGDNLHEWRGQAVAGWFSAANQLSFQRDNIDSSSTITVHWYVFEAKNSEFSVQAVGPTFSIAGSATVGNAAITSVDTTKSFVIGSYRSAYDNDNVRSSAVMLYLSSATQVRAERNYNASLGISNIRAFVVTLSGDATVQRGSLSYTNTQTQATAAVSSVDTNRSMVWNGMSTGPGVMTSEDGGSEDILTAFQRLKLINSTTVQGDRKADAGGTYTAAGVGRFEVVSFGSAGPKPFYRSAGTNAANLNSSGRTVTISGTTATFSGPMPPNVGIGDVLQYQVPPAGPYYLAFISGRTSSTVYSVTSASGGAPQAAPASTAVGVFRAYTSLSNWQAQNENDTLDDTVEDFDTSRDLVAADASMLVACYNDGPMNDTVDIQLWTTGPNNYVRIFTPVTGFQVGASQRHTGVAGTGFRLAPVNATSAAYTLMYLRIPYVRLEGLEIDGSGVTQAQVIRGIRVLDGLTNVGDIRIDSSIIHDLHSTSGAFATDATYAIYGFQQNPNTGPPLTITNNFIYDVTSVIFQDNHHIGGIHVGSRTTSYVYNNTVYRIRNFGGGNPSGAARGITVKAWPNGTGTATVIATNNYMGDVVADFDVEACYNTEENAVLTQSYNVASDFTAAGTGSVNGKTSYASYFVNVTNGSENLHLTAPTSSLAIFGTGGIDLSASFPHDIDGQTRTVAWDIGADEFDGTTAVKLMSFGAVGDDGSVVLEWRTGSELDNLGFHLYRGSSANGPWARLTTALVPGLGSSAVGKAYSFRDSGLTNGVRYYYRLEDVDARSQVTSHGPVWAVPQAAAQAGDDDERGGARRGKHRGTAADECPAAVRAAYAALAGADASPSLPCTRHGDPEAVSLELVERDARQASVELRTGGFYAVHEPGGTVQAFVPGFDFPQDESAAALPIRRALVEAVVGRKVQLAGVRATDLARFPGLVPSRLGKPEMELGRDGTARALRRGGRGASRLAAGELVELLPSVFQGETKSAVMELSPLRYDERRGQLVLARTLRVRLVFAGREPGESGRLARGRRRAPQLETTGEVLARLFTTSRGLHAVSFEQLFAGQRRALPVSQLAVLRQAMPVAFHVEPDADSFGPGARLFFFADSVAASTAYSAETAYELVHSDAGRLMPRLSAAPTGPPLAAGSTARAFFETNRFYQPGLLDAPDPWLWEAVASGVTRSLPLALDGVDAAAPRGGELELYLQGASESGLATDHHLSVALNGAFVGEARFAGKQPHRLRLSLPAALLRDGPNDLAITSVADTGVSSLVFLDRVALVYPQRSAARNGRFEGAFEQGGVASVFTEEPPVALLEIAPLADGKSPVWLTGAALGPGGATFQAEAGGRYLVVSASGLLAPRVAAAGTSSLRSTANRADYLLIAPQELLPAARPLLDRRADQGLATRAVAFEEIARDFGHGLPSAEAIRDFLAFAFHSWAQPSPRYVLLLGDSNYDPRNFSGSAQASPLPALWTRTSYLWTASDPLLAAVNGEDALPDLAIGRLPAANVEEAQRLVDKLLAWEDSRQGTAGSATLVADNPDLGGDFEADVADIAHSFLADRSPQILRVRELGAATRTEVLRSLDAGLAWLAYVGHGGAAVWASENVWNSWDAQSLQPQSRQPLLFTMNCLNGYFVAPNFDSLAESLVKPQGRGAIAAFSPSGLSLDGPAHLYHRALTAEILSGRHQRLGDAILAAQQSYAASGLMPELLAIYHLLGDPAMVVQ